MRGWHVLLLLVLTLHLSALIYGGAGDYDLHVPKGAKYKKIFNDLKATNRLDPVFKPTHVGTIVSSDPALKHVNGKHFLVEVSQHPDGHWSVLADISPFADSHTFRTISKGKDKRDLDYASAYFRGHKSAYVRGWFDFRTMNFEHGVDVKMVANPGHADGGPAALPEMTGFYVEEAINTMASALPKGPKKNWQKIKGDKDYKAEGGHSLGRSLVADNAKWAGSKRFKHSLPARTITAVPPKPTGMSAAAKAGIGIAATVVVAGAVIAARSLM